MSTVLIDSDLGDKVFRFLFSISYRIPYLVLLHHYSLRHNLLKEKYIGFLKIPTLLSKCASWKSELAIL